MLRWKKTRQMQRFAPSHSYPEDYIRELPRSFIILTEGSSDSWVVPAAFSRCP